MRELLEAAKVVLDVYDNASYCLALHEGLTNLRAAVERAEKPSADFMEWWKTFPLNTYGIVPAFHGWEAGQQAERERIKDLFRQSSDWFEDDQMAQAKWLMEKIDATTE